MPEGQLWPFLRMRNSKIRQKIAEANPAKTWSIRQKFMSKSKQVMYNFANKVVGCQVVVVIMTSRVEQTTTGAALHRIFI